MTMTMTMTIITRLPIAGACLAMAALAAPASAQSGWYGAIGASWVSPDLGDQRLANTPAPGQTLVTRERTDNGWGGAVTLGRRMGPLRAEVELGRQRTESDRYDVRSPFRASLPQDGRTTVTRLMGNILYDFGPPTQTVRPFIGVGVGTAEVETRRIAGTVLDPTPRTLIDNADRGFAWQAIAGVSLTVSERTTLQASIRHLDAGDIEGRDGRGQAFIYDLTTRAFDVGLRVKF